MHQSEQNYNMKDNPRTLRAYCDGCFDMVHFGHANLIRQAKAMCDHLVVGVHSDKEIAYHKGPTVFTEEERYRLVRSIKWADENFSFHVVENVPYCPNAELLDKYDCEYCIHGAELTINGDGQDTYEEMKRLGRYRECPRTEGVSTTHNHSETIVQFSSDQQPKPTDQIVYACGTFDLFHIGHLTFLEEAAKLGDYLIVGIYGDDVFEQLDGKRNPIMALHERALSVLSYKPVSEVIIGAPYNLTEDFINRLKIDLVVCATKNANRGHLTKQDQFDIPKKLGKFKLIDSGCSVTTDEIIKRIANNCCEFHLRNKKKLVKERTANDWLQLQEGNSK